MLDLTLCRPPRLIKAELKSEAGEMTPEQQEWYDLLKQVPVIETYLWRPSDYDAIVEILR